MRSILLGLCVVLIGCGQVSGTIIDAPTADAADAAVDVDAAVTCAGLDPLACRSTAGCVADFCQDCDCSPAYMGCRREADPAAVCPDLDCITPLCCHVEADCGGLICLTPSDPPLCGICRDVESQCTTDQECRAAGVGAVLICEPVPCACSPANACVPGCAADADCGEAETCDVPDGRCVPVTCSTADPVVPCPPDFDCIAGPSSHCERRTCTTDATCDGFCAEGLCRDSLGTCTPPPP